MTQNKGLLLVTMEPPPTLEEEFNAWYDTEHLPQRQSVPGIETAHRFICLSGWPRYLATYDLASLEVIESAAYQAISGPHLSPWSRRLIAKVAGYYRAVAEQVYPGTALTHEDQPALRLVLVGFTLTTEEHESNLIEALRNSFEQSSGLIQLRIFKAASSQRYDILGLAEFRKPVSASDLALESIASAHCQLNLLNIYSSYWPYPESKRSFV
jgi:hypothetical protein